MNSSGNLFICLFVFQFRFNPNAADFVPREANSASNNQSSEDKNKAAAGEASTDKN